MSQYVVGHFSSSQHAKQQLDRLIVKGYPLENITVLADHELDTSLSDYYPYEKVDPSHIDGWDASAMRIHAGDPVHEDYEVPMSAWMRLRDAAIYNHGRGDNYLKDFMHEEEKILYSYSEEVRQGKILILFDCGN